MQTEVGIRLTFPGFKELMWYSATPEMDPTDVATATAGTQLRTKDWTVRNDRILAGLVQFEPPLGWHDIACRLGIGADIPACQLRWQALRKAAGSAPKVNSSLEGLGDDDNGNLGSPLTWLILC